MRYKNDTNGKDLKLYAVAGTQTVLLSFNNSKVIQFSQNMRVALWD